jgi:hypothetical protein
MWGKNAINADDKMHYWEQATPERAIANIKDVLSAWKYHIDSSISAILLKQRNRVGDQMAAIEKELDGLTYTTGRGNNAKTIIPYKQIDLKKEWLLWSSGRLARAKQRAEEYMDTWLDSLKEGYATDFLREEARKHAQDEPNLELMIQRIDKLEAILQAKPTWNLAF